MCGIHVMYAALCHHAVAYSADSSSQVITVRWKSAQSPQPVVGISVLETVHAPQSKYNFQVKQIFAEFDSVAWIVNLGIIKPQCAASKREARFVA